MQYKTLLSVVAALSIMLTASALIMFFARGYTINIGDKNLEQTGILSINSTPDGALIYINDVPKDATNNSVTGLRPGTYQIRLDKIGYQSWEKNIEISTGQVTQVQALLISLFPEIRPLTITGASDPIISPDGQKIVYMAAATNVDQTSAFGIWLLNLGSRPFNLLSQPTLLTSATDRETLSSAKISWSPDSQNILVQEVDGNTYVIDVQSKDITPLTTALQQEQLFADWEEERLKVLEVLSDRFSRDLQAQFPSLNQSPIWSPDQTKLLFAEEQEDGTKYTVIDFKPSEYLPLAQRADEIKIYDLSTVYNKSVTPTWYSDSRHLLIFEPSGDTGDIGQMSIFGLDGTNKKTLFSGPVINGDMFPHPDGSRIIILTNFTNDPGQKNLYSISLY